MLDSLSAKGKLWQLPPELEPAAELLAVTEQSLLLAKILQRRGIDAENARAFLYPEHYSPTDPFALPDVDNAIIRINQALANEEQITVYGDYDVDGVTATSLMFTALQKISAKVNYYIPNRASEGYGLNLKAISILASKQKTKLIISCDCGVSNFAEISFAKSLGVDTIILDHHTLPELLPPAKAIVHPKLLVDNHPLYHLPGVGVAYKLAQALLSEHNLASQSDEFLDYVTLGMIADLVPLIRENRYLVQIGLPRLINSPRPGIQALLAQVQQSGDTDLVGFGLAPRINAVGRLADAQIAVELLTTQDKEVATKLSNYLQNENSKRQQICEQVFLEADQSISTTCDLSTQSAIAIYSEGWHHGVVGIVASRLVEKYNRPVFIGELDQKEGLVKGSARGIDCLDLCEILKANSHLLSKWGGHKMAAGFSLTAEKAQSFCTAIVSTCNQMMANKNHYPTINIDLLFKDTSLDLFAFAKQLNHLAPFGMENKKPVFMTSNLTCQKVSLLGRSGKHHRLDLLDKVNNKTFSCVFWNSHNIVPAENDLIDVVFTPEINVFNGKERLQLVLSDWKMAKSQVARTDRTISNASTQQESIALNAPPEVAIAKPLVSNKQSKNNRNWVDLRHFDNSQKLITTAMTTLKGNLAIFSEETGGTAHVFDRLSLPAKPHLIIKQFPPSAAVWQEVIKQSCAEKVYILPDTISQPIEPHLLIKRLLGLVRFVVNQKDGEVEARRIASALATTELVCALALAILRKIEVIDWYSDNGTIYLDLLDQPANTDIKQLSEFAQLDEILKQIHQFRLWCSSAALDEIIYMASSSEAPTQAHNLPTAELDFNVVNTIQSNSYPSDTTPITGKLAQ